MNDLDTIKAFAELEGVELIAHMGKLYRMEITGRLSIGGVNYAEYNPLLPNELNCAARDKYRVEIDYDESVAATYSGLFITGEIEFKTKDEIPRAVIECILKSEGKL